MPHPWRIAMSLLVLSTLLVVVEPRSAHADAPGNVFFERTWQRTDEPVASETVSRTWVWGPEAFSPPVGEEYVDSPGGVRMVQYFDKSRMEINDPAHDVNDLWYVTNGLLARELITGEMQLGDNSWEQRGSAWINIAGDPEDADAPTYASFAGLLDDPVIDEGEAVTATISRDGTVSCCVAESYGVVGGPLAGETGHRVASVFWDYLTSSGPIVERTRDTRGALFANPYYATGFPIGEAYWASVEVKGIEQPVLIQPFERRVLTYTPGNVEGWQVEMGNVGRHYYEWRYGDSGGPFAAPAWSLPAYPEWVPAGQEIAIPDVDAHYDLHISEVNVDSGAVTASQVIQIDAFHGSRPEMLYLQVVPAHFGYFTLDGLWLNGTPVQPERHYDGFILGVGVPRDLPTPLTLAVDFRLNVGTEPTGWGGTSLDSGILRLGYWFPIISDLHGYSDTLDPSQTRVADFTLTVDAPSDVWIAQSGTYVSDGVAEDGDARYVYSGQNMRDFALVLSRGFGVSTDMTASGVELRFYSHTWSEQGLSDEAIGYRQSRIFSAARDAISQLESLIGPYPYGTLTIVDAGRTMPGGLEFPGLIYINPTYEPLERLIYHEVAHQWMYAVIGTRTLIDGWIDEGAAEFFERGLPSGFNEVPSVPAEGYAFWLDSSYEEIAYDGSRQWYYSIYEQGARFYYEVAWTMGWDNFWTAFRNLYHRYAFDVVSAADVLATFQEHSSTDLRPLFDDYFRYPWVWDLLSNP